MGRLNHLNHLPISDNLRRLAVAFAMPREGQLIEIPFLNGGLPHQLLTLTGAAPQTATFALSIAPVAYAELRFLYVIARVTCTTEQGDSLNMHFELSTVNSDGGHPALYQPALGIVKTMYANGGANSGGFGWLGRGLRLEPLLEPNRGLDCTGSVTQLGTLGFNATVAVQVSAMCERLWDPKVEMNDIYDVLTAERDLPGTSPREKLEWLMKNAPKWRHRR